MILPGLAFVVLLGASSLRADPPWPEEWPIVPSPARFYAPPPDFDPPGEPATPAAARALSEVETIRENLRDTAYQHWSRVVPARGIYRFDCSLFVHYVLRRAAPRTVASLEGLDRARAGHFAGLIERAPESGHRRGWQRLTRLSDARPGDVFAWRRPEGFPSRNTGHVGFFLSTPEPVPGLPGGYAARIADATRGGHQDDTRRGRRGGGFGYGTLAFLVDEEGRGTHYGWSGTRSDGYVVTSILVGRLH